MKYLTDQFQLSFCFCIIGNTKYQYYISAMATVV